MGENTKTKEQPALVDMQTRLLIDDLIADCAHALDDDRLEEWPELFIEDGRYKITTRENIDAGWPLGILYCDSRGMMRDRILALRTANVYEPHTYCHILGRTRVHTQSNTGGEVYHARTNFSIIRTMHTGEDFRFATGKYIDECVMINDRMHFKSRIVVLESRRVDILLVIPL